MDKSFSQRKPTRLKKFDYSTVGAYFVTICVKERRKLLSEIIIPNVADTKGRTNFEFVGDGALDVPQIRLTELGEIVEKYLLSSENIPNVTLDEYVIMPDHIHAIIFIQKQETGTSRAPSPTPANEALPHIVSTFKRFCTKTIGSNIFQRSYYDHVIRDREDYETRKKYICENPIKWYYDKIYEDE
ncbi:MAG: hypothetical protein IKL66_02225 [Clostridia bacterium]|nr:hypothetical protein [Clostridia bacterium]